MEQGRLGWQAIGSVLIVGLLAASALQLHAVESRLVTPSQQLRVPLHRGSSPLLRGRTGLELSEQAREQLARLRSEIPDDLR